MYINDKEFKTYAWCIILVFSIIFWGGLIFTLISDFN